MPDKSFIEDMLTLGGGMLGNLAEARHELKAQARQRVALLARDIDLVTRVEFDAAYEMMQKARLMQEELAARLSRIEAHLALPHGKKPVNKEKRNLPSVKTKTKRRVKK